jgi:transcriptional regulator with XRE-family HTH domain
MNIAEKIKAIREKKRIKQIEVANKLDLDPAYYARFEKRGEKLTIEQLKQIANALGVGINELLDIEVQSTDNERVKELEKRVLELNQWLIDKESIIEITNNSINNTLRKLLSELISYEIYGAIEEKVISDELIIIHELDRKLVFEKYFLPFGFITSFIESDLIERDKFAMDNYVREWRKFLYELKNTKEIVEKKRFGNTV